MNASLIPVETLRLAYWKIAEQEGHSRETLLGIEKNCWYILKECGNKYQNIGVDNEWIHYFCTNYAKSGKKEHGNWAVFGGQGPLPEVKPHELQLSPTCTKKIYNFYAQHRIKNLKKRKQKNTNKGFNLG